MLLCDTHVSVPSTATLSDSNSGLRNNHSYSPRSYSSSYEMESRQSFGGIKREIGSTPGYHNDPDQYFPQAHNYGTTPHMECPPVEMLQPFHVQGVQTQQYVPSQGQNPFEPIGISLPGSQYTNAQMIQVNPYTIPYDPAWTLSNTNGQPYELMPLPDSTGIVSPEQSFSPETWSQDFHSAASLHVTSSSLNTEFPSDSISRSTALGSKSSSNGRSTSISGSFKRKSGVSIKIASLRKKRSESDDEADDGGDDEGEDDAEGDVDGDDAIGTPDRKRQRFLARNRVAATRCRLKKKDWMSTLEEKARLLSMEQQQLYSTVNGLRREVLALKCQCLNHAYCECKRIRDYLKQTVATMTPIQAVYEDERLKFKSSEEASASASDLMREAHRLHNPQRIVSPSGLEEL